MPDEATFYYQAAIQDFRRARRRASLEKLFAFLTGKSDELLSYEDVRKKLNATGASGKKLREIPLDAIVGSVGRYRDFTRSFLPRADSDEQRWATVQSLARGMQGFPPIDVYQIGGVYFVADGNHRVSTAKQLGAKYIEAYVIEVQTNVPITPNIQPEELDLKAEYAEFLTRTHLNALRPQTDFSISLPGKYRLLEEQIEEHRYFMGIKEQREIPYNEAVMNWHDTIYLPIRHISQSHKLLASFPGHTETDLYLWISEYRATVRQRMDNQLEDSLEEIRSKLPMLPDIDLDKVILDAEHVNFLEQTRIEEIRPTADIRVTAPGKYQELLHHIDVHQYFMGLERQHDIPYQEAVADWHDTLYFPTVEFIEKQGMLRDFPNRTEADLYLWIAEHRTDLETRLGWKIETEAAAVDLVEHFSPKADRVLARVSEKMFDALTPDELESGPPAGRWRKDILKTRRNDRLFSSMLILISGEEDEWQAFEQALVLAQHEQAYLSGLHVVATKTELHSETTRALQAEFAERCEAAGLQGALAVEHGDIARKICDRSRWTDVMLMNLKHPPGRQPLQRLKSGFRTLVRRCSRPVIAVPQVSQSINRALLAYDGSRKADEALFLSAYIGNYLHIPLVVVAVKEMGRKRSELLSLARDYLQRRKVEATFIEETGPVGDAISATASAHACDMIIMGGYGYSPVLEIMFGSTLDQVLRKSRLPVLISR